MHKIIIIMIFLFSSKTLAACSQIGYQTVQNNQIHFNIPKDYLKYVEEYASHFSVPKNLLIALIWQESRFCHEVISRSGAIGLGQIMPNTAKFIGINPYNVRQNILGSALYLRQQYNTFGSTELALAAYNAGPARVAKCRCIPEITETQNYVFSIMQMYNLLESSNKLSKK